MKWNAVVFAVALVLSGLLSGCSLSIIHPPSAAAFMEKGDGDLQANVMVSQILRVENSDKDYMLKPYNKVKMSPLPDEDHYYKNWEWYFQEGFDVQKQIGTFKIGGGLDWMTPFMQAGFISDYFGVMGWSNICLWQLEKYEHAYFQWGGGITIIEQLPLLSRRLRFGLTQHLSRNGREAYLGESGAMFVSSSAPVFYDEIGGGAYIAGIVGKRLGMGLELRYGRDLTYKIVDGEKEKSVNRFTLTFNVQWW